MGLAYTTLNKEWASECEPWKMESSSESRAQSQHIQTGPLPSQSPCEIHAELNFRCCQAGVPSSNWGWC